MKRGKWIVRFVLLACLCGSLSAAVGTFAQSTSPANVWTVLTFDPKGDARDASLGDAALLSYRYDKAQDVLWFRVNGYGKANEQTFGIAPATSKKPGPPCGSNM